MSDIEFVLGALDLRTGQLYQRLNKRDEFSDRSLCLKAQSTQTLRAFQKVAKFVFASAIAPPSNRSHQKA